MTDLEAWTAAMRRGDFEAAWAVSDRVLARNVAAGSCARRPRHLQWVWDGRPLEGRRLLVRCYHGLGDTIQFARFLPQMGEDVTVWAQAPLIPLLRTLPGRRRLLPLHDGAPDAEYDVDLEIMEIPHALRITLRSLPAEVPYLHVDAAPRPAEGLAVGMVAGAGGWDARRWMPPDLLGRLADIPGVSLFSLQPGARVPGAVDRSHPDLLEAACRVRSLDLVITVDTMMAHLAGALGVPVWILLHADADWRWMEGERSPWYPTARLFRQARPGDWEGVLDQVLWRLRQGRSRSSRRGC